MTIKQKLNISAAFVVLLFIGLAVGLYKVDRTVRVSSAENVQATEIQRNIFELTGVTYDYVLTGSERALGQWKISYETLGSLLEQHRLDHDVHARGDQEAVIYRNLRSEYTTVGELFDRFQEVRSIHDTGGGVMLGKLENTLVSQLTVKTQFMATQTLTLSTISYEHFSTAQQTMQTLGLGFFIFLFGMMFSLIVFVNQSITKPLVRITQAAKDLAGGNFDVVVKVKNPHDEIGQLADAFTKMTAGLKEMFAFLKKAGE